MEAVLQCEHLNSYCSQHRADAAEGDAGRLEAFQQSNRFEKIVLIRDVPQSPHGEAEASVCFLNGLVRSLQEFFEHKILGIFISVRMDLCPLRSSDLTAAALDPGSCQDIKTGDTNLKGKD